RPRPGRHRRGVRDRLPADQRTRRPTGPHPRGNCDGGHAMTETPTSQTPTTDTPTWATLDLDQAVALRAAATRLVRDSEGVVGVETIDRFLRSSFEQFADRATVTRFLPLMAERFARQRLRALAKVEGLHDDGKPPVRFLCV